MGDVKSLGEFYLNTLMNEHDIDWVFFSPAGTLEPGERTGKFSILDTKVNTHIDAIIFNVFKDEDLFIYKELLS